jgi:hypothetical protein
MIVALFGFSSSSVMIFTYFFFLGKAGSSSGTGRIGRIFVPLLITEKLTRPIFLSGIQTPGNFPVMEPWRLAGLALISGKSCDSVGDFRPTAGVDGTLLEVADESEPLLDADSSSSS